MKYWGLIITHSLVFAGCLGGIALSPQNFGFFTGLLLFNVIATKKTLLSGSFKAMIIPAAYAFFSGLLLFFVDTLPKQGVFILLATGLFFLTLRTEFYITKVSTMTLQRGALSASAVGALFLFFASAQGFMINFAIPIWMFMTTYFVVVYGISYAYYAQMRLRGNSTLYSFILAFFFVQLSWIIQFWPFGYLTIGVTMLIFYYVLWDILDHYAGGTFTRRHAILNTVLLIGLTTLVLATSRWTPLY